MIDKNINTWDELKEYFSKLEEMFQAHGHMRVTADWSSERTETQNRALHKYCEMVATALNDAGITFDAFFKEGYNTPWSKYVVKDQIWRPVQKALSNVESTTKIKRAEVGEIYEVVNSKLSEHGIHVPFPQKDGK